MVEVYHITDSSRLAAIAEGGLLPRSAKIQPNFDWPGDDQGVYVFLASSMAHQWSMRCRNHIADPVLLRAFVDESRVHMDSESVRMLIDQCGDISLDEGHPWAVELTTLVKAHWPDDDLDLRDLDDYFELSELAPTLQGMIRQLPPAARGQLIEIAGAGTHWTESMCIHDGPISGVEIHDGAQWVSLDSAEIAA